MNEKKLKQTSSLILIRLYVMNSNTLIIICLRVYVYLFDLCQMLHQQL